MKFIYPAALVLLTIFGVMLSSANPQGLSKKIVSHIKIDTLQLKCDSLAVRVRTLESNNTNLSKQLKQRDQALTGKQKQLNILKLTVDSLNATVATQDATINTCVDQYIFVSGKLRQVLNITACKKLPRKKLKLIECLIENNQ